MPRHGAGDIAIEPLEKAEPLGRLAPLWMQAQPVIAAFIHGMVRERHDVEDLVQLVAETCARKFEVFDEQGGPHAFRSWALSIARIEVLRYYKRQERSTLGFSPDVLESIADEFARREERPDDRLEALRQCLTQVTDRNRQFIEMKYFRGLTAEQISDRLGLSAGAIRVALCRTRQVLAECIQRQLRELEYGSRT